MIDINSNTNFENVTNHVLGYILAVLDDLTSPLRTYKQLISIDINFHLLGVYRFLRIRCCFPTDTVDGDDGMT